MPLGIELTMMLIISNAAPLQNLNGHAETYCTSLSLNISDRCLLCSIGS